MLRKKVNSRSSKIKQGHIGLLRFFVIPIGYLVARDWETMKRNHKDVPIYALYIVQFGLPVIGHMVLNIS